MQLIPNLFMRSPGGENESGSTEPEKDALKAEDLQADANAVPKEEKGFFTKIKDALQDWSNADEQDQEIDDATP